MSSLDARDRELVALGAALGSNCVPCMEHHLPLAQEAGLSDEQISEALRLADELRQVPARRVLDAALRLLAPNPPDSVPADSKGPCGQTADADREEAAEHPPPAGSETARGQSPGSGGRCC